MRNLIEGQSLVMLSNSGLIQIIRVKVYTERAMRLVGVYERRYPLSRLGDLGDDFECGHIIESLLYLVSVLCGHFPLDVLEKRNGKFGPDDVGTGHVAYGVEGVRECLLQGSYVLGCHGRVSCLRWAGLGLLGVGAFRVGLSQVPMCRVWL